MTHIGARLRIRIPAGVICDANSDFLYYRSKFATDREDEQGIWSELFSTVDGLVVETQAVELDEPAPDMEADQADDAPVHAFHTGPYPPAGSDQGPTEISTTQNDDALWSSEIHEIVRAIRRNPVAEVGLLVWARGKAKLTVTRLPS